MRVLVTGAGGFVGKHLIAALAAKGHQVFAGGLPSDIVTADQHNKSLHFDITNYQQVADGLKEIRPEGIIHLAAQSMVKRSWEDPGFTIQVNTIGTINLINAVKDTIPECKIINIGTGEEYGLTGRNGKALAEEDCCLPQNPYAISKFAAGQTAMQLAGKDKLKLIHVRPFNHFGPGQQLGFVISDFAFQIVQIEKKLSPPVIYVGDLSAQRDFSDVRDVVNAYIMLLEGNVDNGTYNVCSGIPRSINSILQLMLKQAAVKITVEVDSSRLRPSEVPLFFGSSQKIEQAVGWKPTRNFSASLAETLDWWREHNG